MPFEALQCAMEANVPVLLTGKPGTAKTQIIRALCRQRGWPIETVIASICEPSDLGGLPVIDNGGVRRVPPQWATSLDKQCGDGRPGAMFFDELSTAAPSNQAAVLRISQERVVGDLELPQSVRFIAACNPVELSAGGWELSAPLANRLCHLNWSLDANVWVRGMQSNFPDPEILQFDPKWRDNIPKYMSLVSSFIKTQPHKLILTPSDESRKGQAWASPRTWHMGAILLACSASQNKLVQLELLSGTVGEGPGAEFFAWLDRMDLPAPELVLNEPKKYLEKPKQDQEHRTYAILAAAISLVRNAPSKEMWDKGWTLLTHASQWSADVAIAFGRDLVEVRVEQKMVGEWKLPDVAKPFVKRMGRAMEIKRDEPKSE